MIRPQTVMHSQSTLRPGACRMGDKVQRGQNRFDCAGEAALDLYEQTVIDVHASALPMTVPGSHGSPRPSPSGELPITRALATLARWQPARYAVRLHAAAWVSWRWN